MKYCRFMLLLLSCAIASQVVAQDFSTLRRSTGKAEVYDAVEKALSGTGDMTECKQLIANADLGAPKNGKTPIYLVLDYIATHPVKDCGKAEQLLDAFLSRHDFDVNLRYGKLLPPLAYLIRANYDFLGKQFNKDYISDHVLQSMIEAGASVNTYLEDGCTLMDFASTTDNKYLQSYFINQGIDLRHQSSTGEDVVYRLIADGKFENVKQAVERGIIQIDINNLKNDPRSFAQYPDMYNFIASHVSKQVETYEDIVLFRTRFSDRKEYVRHKYEAIAQKEVSLANHYNSIMTCKKRFPDLEHITEPKYIKIANNELNACRNIVDLKVCEKRYSNTIASLIDLKRSAFYLADSKDLEASYAHAQELVRLGSFYYDGGKADVARLFYTNYHGYYDPDNRISLALDLSNFYSALGMANSGYYTSYINLPHVGIDRDAIKRHKDNLESAYRILSSCGHNLSSQEMLASVGRDIQEAQRCANKSIREYRVFCEELRKNIRVTQNKTPSGELERGLFETYHHPSNRGEITIEISLDRLYRVSVTYNAFYYNRAPLFRDPEYEFQHYGITSTYVSDDLFSHSDLLKLSSYKNNYLKFKSVGELERGIVNLIIELYYSYL